MKLWLVYQDENNGYDTYDSMVVAAESEDDARKTLPGTYEEWGREYSAWASSPDKVSVKLIGEAAPGIEAGPICTSFNAG